MKIWVALRKESRTSLGLDIARPCAPVGPPHRIWGFRVSRNVRSLLERLWCGRTRSSPSPLSSSSSSSALPTPNNKLLSLIPNVFQVQARSPRAHFVHHVVILRHYADGGVSGVVWREQLSAGLILLVRAETWPRDKLDDKRERYRLEICCRKFRDGFDL